MQVSLAERNVTFEKQKKLGPVAQLARALHLQCRGHGFDSRRVHQEESDKLTEVLYTFIRCHEASESLLVKLAL